MLHRTGGQVGRLVSRVRDNAHPCKKTPALPFLSSPFLVLAVTAVALYGAHGVELKCGADHHCDMLPDMSDPTNVRHVKCGACQLAAVHLAHAVIRKEAALKKKMREDSAIALLEAFCERGVVNSTQHHMLFRLSVQMQTCCFPITAHCDDKDVVDARMQCADIAEYGLQLDSDGRPLPKFTNAVTLNRAVSHGHGRCRGARCQNCLVHTRTIIAIILENGNSRSLSPCASPEAG
jgi:hypothetical protein